MRGNQKMRRLGRWMAFVIVVLFLFGYGLYTMRVNLGSREVQQVEGYLPIPEECIDEANKLPIQSGGREKPFITWAKFLTYSLHGSSSMKIQSDGETYKLGSTEIILQCLFRPDFTHQLELFRVEDKMILTSLGVEEKELNDFLASKEKRDRYSFNELKGFLPILASKAETLQEQGRDTWSPQQRQTVNLTDSLIVYSNLTSYFHFARDEFAQRPDSEGESAPLSAWMVDLDYLLKSIQLMQEEKGRLSGSVEAIWHSFEVVATKSGDTIHMLPPREEEGDQARWKAFGLELAAFFQKEHPDSKTLLVQVSLMEDLAKSFKSNDHQQMLTALQNWNKLINSKLDDDLSKRLESEVNYTSRKYFFMALLLLFPALLLLLLSWVFSGRAVSKILKSLIFVLVSISCASVIFGITHRCILMGRPPIGNLFDTIIFIAGLSLFILLVIEVITKKSLASGLAVFLGMGLLFLAHRYEIGDGKDNLDPLVAVLDSNFWLATHVVTITLGYMGGLVAAGLSATYILGRVFRVAENESEFCNTLNRTAYGMLGFTLLFSLIGTVLGGIWANDSWGRFWGWDPKENGALMIVLWCLILLHARLAGHLREWGIHIASVMGANVVVFSWWHVNSLSTGLHSYGFIEGINAIWGVYGLTSFIALIGFLARFWLKPPKRNQLSLSTSLERELP